MKMLHVQILQGQCCYILHIYKKYLASLKQKLWVSKIPLIQLNADRFPLTICPLSCREH